MSQGRQQYDYVIVGGGFYGCCLALYLRSISANVVVLEAGDKLLDRASRVNQARIHTGFHYPRSVLTAAKSKILYQRFTHDFPEAVVDDFQMLYAIARRRSKVSAKRFYRMFNDIDAPISKATPSQMALFDENMIEGAFSCTEMAFDYSVLRQLMTERLDAHGIELRRSCAVETLTETPHGVVLGLSDGCEIEARYTFNITYAQINQILSKANLPLAHLKHELAEIVLVKPPVELSNLGVTVMDGPFFSCMPYPADNLYSLTHVRYTPHESWIDQEGEDSPYDYFKKQRPKSRALNMIRDSQRYMPCLERTHYEKSIYDVKTVLIKNEHDDGRPILYQRKPPNSRIISILGGKIDNIYDLFYLIRKTDPEFAAAEDTYVISSKN